MTVQQAVQKSKYSKSVIYDELAMGRLKATKISRKKYTKYDIAEEDLVDWLKWKRGETDGD